MFIKPLYDEPYVYDAFLGTGWKNWVRFRRLRNTVEIINKADHINITENLKTFLFFKSLKLEKESREKAQ